MNCGIKSLTKDNNALYVIDGVPIFNTGKSGGEGLFGEMGGSDAVDRKSTRLNSSH